MEHKHELNFKSGLFLEKKLVLEKKIHVESVEIIKCLC